MGGTPAFHYKGRGFNPWVGKIPWRRERLPTPVLWPGKFHGLYSPRGRKKWDTTERLSLHTYTMEYYLAVKKNEVMPFAAMWMNLESVILSTPDRGEISITSDMQMTPLL